MAQGIFHRDGYDVCLTWALVVRKSCPPRGVIGR